MGRRHHISIRYLSMLLLLFRTTSSRSHRRVDGTVVFSRRHLLYHHLLTSGTAHSPQRAHALAAHVRAPRHLLRAVPAYTAAAPFLPRRAMLRLPRIFCRALLAHMRAARCPYCLSPLARYTTLPCCAVSARLLRYLRRVFTRALPRVLLPHAPPPPLHARITTLRCFAIPPLAPTCAYALPARACLRAPPLPANLVPYPAFLHTQRAHLALSPPQHGCAPLRH